MNNGYTDDMMGIITNTNLEKQEVQAYQAPNNTINRLRILEYHQRRFKKNKAIKLLGYPIL